MQLYVIFKDGNWWMRDPSGKFDGGWVADCSNATAFLRDEADRWVRRVGGEVLPLDEELEERSR